VSSNLLAKFLDNFWKKDCLDRRDFNWFLSIITCRLFPSLVLTSLMLRARICEFSSVMRVALRVVS